MHKAVVREPYFLHLNELFLFVAVLVGPPSSSERAGAEAFVVRSSKRVRFPADCLGKEGGKVTK